MDYSPIADQIFKLSINSIQPSQLFINTVKLETVLKNFTCQQLQNEVNFPVITLGGNPVFSDGPYKGLCCSAARHHPLMGLLGPG